MLGGPDFLMQKIDIHKYIHAYTGQLIFRKISKIGATICQILRLKCTKFDFRWSFAPDPAGGAYSAPQTPYLYLRGLLLMRGGEGEWNERGRKRKGKGREGERRGRKGGSRKKCEAEGPQLRKVASPPLLFATVYWWNKIMLTKSLEWSRPKPRSRVRPQYLALNTRLRPKAIDPYCQRQKCRPMTRFWRYKFYADIHGDSLGRGVKRQWGCRQRRFSVCLKNRVSALSLWLFFGYFYRDEASCYLTIRSPSSAFQWSESAEY